MDTLNVSTEENSITQTNILPENEIFNDDSSWVIENVRKRIQKYSPRISPSHDLEF